MVTAIQDFKIKESYAKLISKALFSYLWQAIYKPMFDIWEIKLEIKAKNKIENYEPVIEALKNGEIFYVENKGFEAKNKFKNKISAILEGWGAKFNKWKGIYVISRDKIPSGVLVAIAENKIMQEQKIKIIKSYLDEVLNNIPYMVDSMIFDDEVITILDDAGKEVKKNVKALKIIEPKLTPKQKRVIAEEYTNNMKFFVKDWAENRISEMRKKVQQLILKGYRADEVEKFLINEYNVAKNKAKFLAENETNIMMSEYKKVTYQSMGSTKFVWRTITDGKERELHKQLNGTTWSWDNPPVIDERTGQTGLPGQTYNCRCMAQPLFSDDLKMHNQYSEKQSEYKLESYLEEYKKRQEKRRKA